MMTWEVKPTAEKRHGPARAIPLLRRAIPNNVPGTLCKLTDLTHEIFTFSLPSQLVLSTALLWGIPALLAISWKERFQCHNLSTNPLFHVLPPQKHGFNLQQPNGEEPFIGPSFGWWLSDHGPTFSNKRGTSWIASFSSPRAFWTLANFWLAKSDRVKHPLENGPLNAQKHLTNQNSLKIQSN